MHPYGHLLPPYCFPIALLSFTPLSAPLHPDCTPTTALLHLCLPLFQVHGMPMTTPPPTPLAPLLHPEHVEKPMQAAASKKGAMRALGRVVRDDEAANEVVAAGGLAPVIALLTCNDAAVVRR